MTVKVKALRENANMTQEEMAEKLGLASANAYSLKERGERRFSLEEARVIAELFKLPIEDIFFEKTITKTVKK